MPTLAIPRVKEPIDTKALARAIATAKGEKDHTPYLAKMGKLYSRITGKPVKTSQGHAALYEQMALANLKVAAIYKRLVKEKHNG